MKGTFKSSIFPNKHDIRNGIKNEFETEEELTFLLQKWFNAALYNLYLNNYLYKRQKVYEININEKNYFIIFPPFLKKENIEKENLFYNFQKLENIEKYYEKHIDFFKLQLKTIKSKIYNNQDDKKILINNLFENIDNQILDKNQVINLCSKLSTPYVRNLLKDCDKNIEKLQQIAMKTYEKYGNHFISFILSLPKMEFGKNESKLFVEEKNFDINFQSFTLIFDKNGDEYIITFYPKFERNTLNNTIACVINKTKNNIEGFIQEDGFLQINYNEESLKSSLFVENLKNGKLALYCGIETGQCINCGKDLSDPKSLKLGYGKDCAHELGIPYE